MDTIPEYSPAFGIMFSFGDSFFFFQVLGTGYSLEGGLCCTGGERIVGNSHPSLSRVIEIGCICNNATLSNGILIGQPTEGALLVLAMKVSIHVAELFWFFFTLHDRFFLLFAYDNQ